MNEPSPDELQALYLGTLHNKDQVIPTEDAAPVAQPGAYPDCPQPSEATIEAAIRDIRSVLANMKGRPGSHERIVTHSALVRALIAKHQHERDASEWAIHRLVQDELLTAQCGRDDSPSFLPRGGSWQGGESYPLTNLGDRLIGSTPELWKCPPPPDPLPAGDQAGPDRDTPKRAEGATQDTTDQTGESESDRWPFRTPEGAARDATSTSMKVRARMGRKPDTDIDADRRLSEAWQTGAYLTYAALATERRISKSEVRKAIDRHRKRIPPRKN